jgi:hypothetical protein
MSQLPPRLRHTRNADGGVVLDIDRGKMFSTNATGAVLFELLSVGLGDNAIIAEFAKRFGVSTEVAAADLNRFRESLRQHALSFPPPVVPR